jgi:hypothetical protein
MNNAKGAQPEQLVEEVREYLDRFTVGVDMLPPYLLDLATALSECRERNKLLEAVVKAAERVANVRQVTGGDLGAALSNLDFKLDALDRAQPPSEASEDTP